MGAGGCKIFRNRNVRMVSITSQRALGITADSEQVRFNVSEHRAAPGLEDEAAMVYQEHEMPGRHRWPPSEHPTGFNCSVMYGSLNGESAQQHAYGILHCAQSSILSVKNPQIQ